MELSVCGGTTVYLGVLILQFSLSGPMIENSASVSVSKYYISCIICYSVG